MSKHTPKPWSIEHQQPTPPTNGTLVTDLAGDTVARIYGLSDPNDGEGGQETYANARLIAAAPELLEAMENLLEDIEDRAFRRYLHNPVVSAARAAIAHATGDA